MCPRSRQWGSLTGSTGISAPKIASPRKRISKSRVKAGRGAAQGTRESIPEARQPCVAQKSWDSMTGSQYPSSRNQSASRAPETTRLCACLRLGANRRARTAGISPVRATRVCFLPGLGFLGGAVGFLSLSAEKRHRISKSCGWEAVPTLKELLRLLHAICRVGKRPKHHFP